MLSVRQVLVVENSKNEKLDTSPRQFPNIFALSLIRLIVASSILDLQTLLNFAKTCKGCSEMLESLERAWKVAVEHKFCRYHDLDIRSWIQTLVISVPVNPRKNKKRKKRHQERRQIIVSALHPLPRAGAEALKFQQKDIATMATWCVARRMSERLFNAITFYLLNHTLFVFHIC